MLQLIMRSVLAAGLILVTAGYATAAFADAQTYQIIKATDTRVWRLNTRTGEIAVCSLDDEQLLCTSSAQAITPPAKTYADLEAERVEEERVDAQRREEKRKRSLAMFDLMINAFREIAIAGAATEESN